MNFRGIITDTDRSGGDKLVYVMVPFALAAVFYDFAGGKIPNRLIGIGLLAAVSYMLGTRGVLYMFELAAGMAIPIVLLFALFHMRALGGGDLKLLSFLGCFFGLRIIEVIIYAFLFGACQSLVRLLLNHPFFQRFHITRKHTIHFALAIFLAAFYVSLQLPAAW